MFADRVDEIADWDQIKLLTVAVDRLQRWHRPGLLCIGDAAHAMSPIGGVGVNLAVQDAVAAANICGSRCGAERRATTISRACRSGASFRRASPQRIQVTLQNNVISRVLQASGELKAPLPIRLLARFPLLRRSRRACSASACGRSTSRRRLVTQSAA